MDAKQLIEMANSSLSYLDDGELDAPTESAERYHTTEVSTTFNGHPVRIEFTETDSSPAAYRYNATVYDAETGDLIATGNGGTSWEDAFSIVHWGDLTSRWPS